MSHHTIGRFVAPLAVVAAIAGSASAQLDVTINVSFTPERSSLRGQSNFFQTRTDGGTSGGQLDGVSFPGASIQFTEIFPPPSIADFLQFGYFGLMETRDEAGAVIDTSLVVALRQQPLDRGFTPGVGQSIQDIFAALVYNEAQLVDAMSNEFDTDEFFALGNEVGGSAIGRGDIGIPSIARPGETLNLIAFIGGDDGVLGVDVGDIGVIVTPTPGATALLGLSGAAMLRRRR
jgi:hypothetical protein